MPKPQAKKKAASVSSKPVSGPPAAIKYVVYSMFGVLCLAMMLALAIAVLRPDWIGTGDASANRGQSNVCSLSGYTQPGNRCQKPVTSTANNYEECKAAFGSKLLETYPEQCVAVDGRTFVNTSQL